MLLATFTELQEKLLVLQPDEGRLTLVGLSGFGGSGKSTLANRLHTVLSGSAVVPIDDFIIKPQTEHSTDWDTFDRARLRRDILEAARAGESLTYLRQQSGIVAAHQPGTQRTITPKSYLIVEGCGVLHPELMPYYDYSIWIDCPQAEALQRAKARDQAQGRPYELWDTVWGPDDRIFFERFRPDLLADDQINPAAFGEQVT